MKVCGDEVSVALPLGIYNTREAFFTAVQEAARDQHPKQLRLFGVKYSPARSFVGPPFFPLLIPLLDRIEYPLLVRATSCKMQIGNLDISTAQSSAFHKLISGLLGAR